MNATKTKVGLTTCGFCSNGAHERCPGGVRNGNGSIFLCRCRCDNAGQPRCTECNHRGPGEVTENWHCVDQSGCQARVNKKLDSNPIIRSIREARAAAAAARAAERAAQFDVETEEVSVHAAAPAPGTCLCGCGGSTGGKFRPGHDARFLSRLVDRYRAAANFIIDADTDALRQQAYDISPAFGAKFDKRVGA